MFVVLSLLVLVLGLGVGSFVNVLVDRHERGERIRGRSYCEVCKKILRWSELLPVLSFVFQKGRCRSCRVKLSIQYPIVEILTGVSFVLVFFGLVNSDSVDMIAIFQSPFGFWEFIFLLKVFFGFVFASLLVAIFVYDLKHKIIPNKFSYTFALLALAGVLFQFVFLPQNFADMSGYILLLLAGPALALPFAFLWFISGGKWMGLGDAKLALGIGWILGIAEGFTAVTIGFWIGALVGVGLMAYERLCGKEELSRGGNELTMKSELPLAPFLIIGFVVVFLFSINFFHTSALL